MVTVVVNSRLPPLRLLPLLLLLMALPSSVVRGQQYCDSSYVSVRMDCCTPRSVMPMIGQCCLPSRTECRCNRALLGEAQWAVCTANFFAPDPTRSPTILTSTTTTARPTTTSTTTTSAATTAKPRLCPSVPSAVVRRLLNGDPVTDICSHNGVMGLSINLDSTNAKSNRKITFCNAVMTFNPQSIRRELVMDDTCWSLLGTLEQQQFRPYATSQGVDFPMSTSWVLFSSNYTVFSTLSSHTVAIPTATLAGFLDSLVAQCDNTACLYNPHTMSSFLDMSRPCFLLSYGSSGYNPITEDFDYKGLLRVDVNLVRSDKCGYLLTDTDIVCTELTPPDSMCIGDTSAGLFCPLSTGETAFLGVTGFANLCTGNTMYVAVSTKFVLKNN